MTGGRSVTWLCDPYEVHLASWQNGTQTHPGTQKEESPNEDVKKGAKLEFLTFGCMSQCTMLVVLHP